MTFWNCLPGKWLAYFRLFLMLKKTLSFQTCLGKKHQFFKSYFLCLYLACFHFYWFGLFWNCSWKIDFIKFLSLETLFRRQLRQSFATCFFAPINSFLGFIVERSHYKNTQKKEFLFFRVPFSMFTDSIFLANLFLLERTMLFYRRQTYQN